MKKLLGFLMSLVLSVSCLTTGVMAAPADTAKASTPTAPNYPYRNVMYYGDWSVYGGQHNFDPCDMQGNLITHLNFAFMDFDANGELVLCDSFADFEKGLKDQQGLPYGGPYTGVIGGMIALRDKNPNVRIGVSVGGWTRCGDFSSVCASDSKRANLVNNLMKFIDYVGFDFVDIDWEYPGADRKPDPEGSGVTIDEGCPAGPQDKQNFTKLMRDLRAGLDELGAKNGKYYELSCAMSANPAMMDNIEYDKVMQYADFINMMTYDLNGAWAPFTAHQSPLYTNPAAENLAHLDPNACISIDSTIKYLKKKYNNTLDLSKIVVGVCAYTRGWGGVHNEGYAMQAGQTDCPGLFATSTPNSIVAPDKTTSGTWAYGDVHEIKSRYNLKEYWDDVAKAPYLYGPGTGKDDGYLFTYDNPKSAALKGQYVKDNGLGGLICWMASQDPNEEITTAMKESLYGSAAIPEQPIIVGKADVTVDVKPAENGSISITLKNNSKPVEHNDALKRAEAYQKTIMMTKLYINTTNDTTFTAGMMAGNVNGNCVDLAPLYDASTLKPGASHTFTIRPNNPDFKIDDITSITLTQRKKPSGEEFGEQVVYGDENYDPTVVNNVKLDKTSLKMNVGDTAVLKETVLPASAVDKTVTWESSDDKIVSVKNGKLTALEAGAAVIKVVTNDGKLSATCRVTVTDPNKVSSVELNKKTAKIAVGKDVTLTATVLPATVKDKDIVWTSSDEKVATVVNGKVTAVAEGNATIKALNKKSGKFAVCSLTVVASGSEGSTGGVVTSGNLPAHMVTGYWHNFCNGSANLKLSEVPDYYDMICVAFTENDPIKNGYASFKLDDELCAALGGYTEEEFIQDIQDLRAKGQHVIISVGGAEGRIVISSEADAKVFADSMINVIDKYGFEGVDIDLEGGAVAGTQYIASALRTLHDHYGEDFIITMAPETLYIMTKNSTYSKLLIEVKDILTMVYPQFYNTGAMNGYKGDVVNPSTADMMTSMSTTLIEDCGLRPDQIGFGVPAMSRAGGNYMPISEIDKAVNAFVTGTKANKFTAPHAYPGFRGMMTWSINWDATQNYSWAKHMSDLMDSLGDQYIPPVPTPQPVTSVTLNQTSMKLTEGESKALKATIKPANADNRKLTWKTSNPAVATVKNGTVVAVKKGTATITVSSANGKTSSCKVTVDAKPSGGDEGTGGGSGSGDNDKPLPGDTWDPNKVYNGGETVTYNGEQFQAKWWTRGDRPDASNEWGVWKYLGKDEGSVTPDPTPTPDPDPTPTPDPDPVPTPDPDPTPTPDPDPTPTPDPDPTPTPGNQWKLEGTYNAGDVVTYQGKDYKCRLGHTAWATDWNPKQAPTLWEAK